MTQERYDRFKELRTDNYVNGRLAMINGLFDQAAVNFGYSIELSLKFLLAHNGKQRGDLNKHDLNLYYNMCISEGHIPRLRVSESFLRFADERFNARYPGTIMETFKANLEDSLAFTFPIDMLHCYDDFILQLDEAVANHVNDSRVMIGFRCSRELLSPSGRLFYHCNDHAFERLELYKKLLRENRDEGDNYNAILEILENPVNKLWNFPGALAYRPWGPKQSWHPAEIYEGDKLVENKVETKGAQWQTNAQFRDLYLTSVKIMLEKGKYKAEMSTKTVVKP